MSRVVILEENQDNPFHTFNGESSTLINGSDLKNQELVIDKVAYTVYLKGDKISFPKKEFELLLLLASNPKKVFKREEILTRIWGNDFRPKDSRSLDVHIRMLRKKLTDTFITTIRGVGYKLEK